MQVTSYLHITKFVIRFDFFKQRGVLVYGYVTVFQKLVLENIITKKKIFKA